MQRSSLKQSKLTTKDRGDRVFVDGEVNHNKSWHKVSSFGTLQHIGEDACLVSLDNIDGKSATVIVKSKFIFDCEDLLHNDNELSCV